MARRCRNCCDRASIRARCRACLPAGGATCRGRGHSARRQEEGLNLVTEHLTRFIERSLLAQLADSRTWGTSHPLALERIRLATARIRFELACRTFPGERLILDFEEQSYWLLAGIRQAGWLTRLDWEQRRGIPGRPGGFLQASRRSAGAPSSSSARRKLRIAIGLPPRSWFPWMSQRRPCRWRRCCSATEPSCGKTGSRSGNATCTAKATIGRCCPEPGCCRDGIATDGHSPVLVPKFYRKSRNVLKITAIARNQGCRTRDATRRDAEIVCGTSDFVFPPFFQQRLGLLGKRQNPNLANVVKRLLEQQVCLFNRDPRFSRSA